MSEVERLLELKEEAKKTSESLSRFAYAIDQYLGELPPPTDEVGYDLQRIAWQDAQGQRGPYQKTDDVNNNDYKALRKDLKEHNGKMRKHGFFLWVFQNGITVGRKKV